MMGAYLIVFAALCAVAGMVIRVRDMEDGT